MSDPGIEEESLISQDDIDALLDASSIEEAEQQIDASQALEDDLGELSQDDIDNLLNGSSLNGDAPDASASDPEDDDGAGELSQDDIDSLMGGSPDIEPEDDEEDLELISQDDIDRLMNPSDEGEAVEDDELISMDDIQGLINGEGGAEEEAPEDASVQEEISADPESEPEPEPEPVKAEAETEADPLDDPIDDAGAMDVADCLITQDTMDALMEDEEGPRDVVDLGEEISDADASEAQDSPPVGVDEDDFLSEDPAGDLDLILESDDLDLGADAEGETDVTQEDIDALLQESDEDDDFLDEDDDILISQDDIDTLLMAADQEDEDVLGDLMGDEADFEMDEDFDVGDIMGDEEDEEIETEADQVVLAGAGGEAADEAGEPEAGEPKFKKVTALFRSKIVLAAASVILVIGISVPLAYFLFFSGEEPPLPQRESVPLAELGPDPELEVASITIEEAVTLPVARQPGTIVLADFVILASDLSKQMTYIYADIAIDYSDQRAYHDINNNLSFYRDLIYGAIQASLVSEKRDEVTEADLIWGVETSLKKVLPPHYIKKISFKTFRTS